MPGRSFAFLSMLRVATTLLVALARSLPGQSAYYNLDSGRPTRVEDAVATERAELELQLLPFRGEWVGDGTRRLRYEPKAAYGVLPLTEIELRIPVVETRGPNSAPAVGVASAGLGVLHAFNVETSWPAMALAAELVLPIGSMSAPTGSYSVKGLLTKTFRYARMQLNVAGGTWSVRGSPVAVPQGYTCGNAPGVPPCLIPDVPCNVIPVGFAVTSSVACAPGAALPNGSSSSASAGSRTTGPHWTAALGVDHTFPLRSTLVVADVVVDRFAGLYRRDDWTAELGVRHQLALQLVLDAGVSRRFAGTTQSTSLTVGLSYSMPWR